MRLIDADKVMEEIHRIGGHNLCEWDTIGVKALIDRQPTVDIKTEVAREIFVEIKQGLEELSNAFREKSDYSGVVYTIPARAVVINLENKYTKEGVGE